MYDIAGIDRLGDIQVLEGFTLFLIQVNFTC